MTKFIKPRGKVDYTELGFEAGVKAMLDAQVNYDDIESGVACYCYGESRAGSSPSSLLIPSLLGDCLRRSSKLPTTPANHLFQATRHAANASFTNSV